MFLGSGRWSTSSAMANALCDVLSPNPQSCHSVSAKETLLTDVECLSCIELLPKAVSERVVCRNCYGEQELHVEMFKPQVWFVMSVPPA